MPCTGSFIFSEQRRDIKSNSAVSVFKKDQSIREDFQVSEHVKRQAMCNIFREIKCPLNIQKVMKVLNRKYCHETHLSIEIKSNCERLACVDNVYEIFVN